jgi:biopolymer transport protein ExbD
MKIRLPRRRIRIIMFAMPDIAFLLLIFLILTVSVAEENEVEVPRFKFTQETDFPDVVAIQVDREGIITIQGEKYEYDELPTRLGLIGEGTVTHIIADGEADYLVVDTVLSALKAAGVTDVVLIAESDDNL